MAFSLQTLPARYAEMFKLTLLPSLNTRKINSNVLRFYITVVKY